MVSDDEGISSTAIREISFLMSLRHPNTVHLQQVLCGPCSLTMVFENLEYDLKKYMEWKIDKMSLDEIKWIMYQLLVGMTSVTDDVLCIEI